MNVQQLLIQFITVTFLTLGHESLVVNTKWDEVDCVIQIFRKHYCRGETVFSWGIKDEDKYENRRIWPSFIPRSLRTTGPCQWILCSAKRLGKGQMKCNRIPGNKTFTHQTDWKWTNHRLAWVRKAKNQPKTELRVAMPLQSSRRYQNESKMTLKLPSDEMKENDKENDISEVQEVEITTETPFETELLVTETELPDITTLKSQTEFKGTTELPDPPEFSTQTENTIKAKNVMDEMSNLELESHNSVQKAAKMTHEEDVKSKEKIAVATVLREEEEGAKAEKEKMSAVLQQNSDKEQKILQASSLAIPQKQQQQQSNEEIPENSLKNNENSRKKENLKEDKSERPLTTEAGEVVIEKEFFNATDALQEEKDVTIEEQRIGVAASEASEAAEANTKKVVKESEKEILHTSTEKTTEKQFNYAETKVKVEQQNPRRRLGMFQGWRYRLQTILRTLEEEDRLKKRLQDERKDFEEKSTSHKLLRTTVASSAAATSLRPPSPPPARSQQEATDEVEAIQIDSSWQRQQEPKDLSTTLTLPFTTQEILEPSKEKYSGRNGFPRDSSAEQPSFSKEPENWEILIICLGITSGLMAFLTVFSAFKYQFLKSWPAEKKKKNQVEEAETQAFYGVKFEALKQHDMTTDEHEQEDDKTTRLVCK